MLLFLPLLFLSSLLPSSDMPPIFPLSEEWEMNEWIIPTPYLPDHSLFQNQIMQYAYKISQNKDFLYTLKAECGSIDPDCRGATNDFGLCQLHYKYHKDFIRSDEFQDWEKQINYCWQIYRKAENKGTLSTTFYAWNQRQKVKHFFIF